MAKQKGGLGRGLGSLLGVGFDSATPAVPAVPEVKREENASAGKTVILPKTARSAEEERVAAKGVVDGNVAPDQANIASAGEGEAPSQQGITSRAESPVKKILDDEVPDYQLSIDLIEPNPDQPRTNFDPEELEELAESIRANGLISPILVRKYGDKYQIIAGERRWQACKLIGMKTVPVRVKNADDDETIILALVENIQRSNLNPIEEAYGYRRMMERGKMTQAEVARAVSKGRTTVTNALRLLELPEDAQQLLFEGKITAGHARAALSIPTDEGRRKLVDKIVSENLSVRDAERIARLMSGKKMPSDTPRQPTPKSYKTVARALSDSLETDVKIRSARGKNHIQITFEDEEDLQRLFKLIAADI